jgi:hypothetical protein
MFGKFFVTPSVGYLALSYKSTQYNIIILELASIKLKRIMTITQVIPDSGLDMVQNGLLKLNHDNTSKTARAR